MANQFIRDLSTNVKRGLRAKVKRGEFPSTAPTGYLNDTRRKIIVIDRKKSKVIREAFELYSQGESRLEDISNFYNISPNYTKAAQFLSDWLPRLNSTYELVKTQSSKGKGEVVASSHPTWR